MADLSGEYEAISLAGASDDATRARDRDRADARSQSARFRRYAQVLVGGLVLYALVVAPLNLLVDPHDTFPALALSRFAPHRLTDSRITKANRAARGSIDIAVLGSSRAAAALVEPPRRASGARFLNLAVPNTSLAELHKIGAYLLSTSRPRELVIGVEFDFFNYELVPDELMKSRFNPALQTSELLFEQALGRFSLEKSLEVVRASRGEVDPAARLSRLAKFEIVLGDAVRLAHDVPPPPHYPPARLALLRETVERARSLGSEVSVVMLPVHASMLLTYDPLGLWSRFETWKRDVLATVAGTGAIVWDFNGTDPRQAEPLPFEHGPMQDMQWFTDASHCTRAYGSLLLERIGEPAAPDDALGVRLTEQNLEARLEAVRRSQAELLLTRPDLTDLAKRMVDQERARRTQGGG